MVWYFIVEFFILIWWNFFEVRIRGGDFFTSNYQLEILIVIWCLFKLHVDPVFKGYMYLFKLPCSLCKAITLDFAWKVSFIRIHMKFKFYSRWFYDLELPKSDSEWVFNSYAVYLNCMVQLSKQSWLTDMELSASQL